MKILYVITAPDRGGAQAHVLDLLRSFHPAHEVTLATGEEGYLTGEARKLGVTVYILEHLTRPIRIMTDIRAFREIRQLIRCVQPDLVHCHSTKAGILGRLAARTSGTPGLVTVHGWTFSDGFSASQRLIGIVSEWITARFSRYIITVAEAQRALALQWHIARPGQLITVHNGIPDLPQRASPADADQVNIIMVARFQEPKDHMSPLQALATLNTLPYRLIYVGDGPLMPPAQAETERLGITDKVDFMGARSDVPDLLTQSHIFLLTSDSEGFPISILEAMRAGLPVVATDVGGIRESVLDGKTGFVVPKRDVEMLKKRLEQLIRDPNLRNQMGEAGREHFEQHFTRTHMIDKTLAVYQTI